LIVHGGSKAEVPGTSRGGRVRWATAILGLLGLLLLLLLLLLKLGLSEKFDLILLRLLEAEDFHLHHLHLQTLSRLNVYAWTERHSVGVDLVGRALLVGKPGAVHSRG
jgi:hypothetical protein